MARAEVMIPAADRDPLSIGSYANFYLTRRGRHVRVSCYLCAGIYHCGPADEERVTRRHRVICPDALTGIRHLVAHLAGGNP
jgi:hypothetical protein